MKKVLILMLLISANCMGQYDDDVYQHKIEKANGVTEERLPIDSVTKMVDFRIIINLDSTYTSEKIYALTKEWFSSNSKEFNRGTSDKNENVGDLLLGTERGNSVEIDQLYKNDHPLKMEDSENKKLIGKGVMKYTGGSMGCVRIIYLEYDLKVAIKDFKLKLDITNFNYTHYNQIRMKQSDIHGFDESCGAKGSIEKLLTCQRCKGEMEKFYNYLKNEMLVTSINFKTFLKNNKGTEDEW